MSLQFRRSFFLGLVISVLATALIMQSLPMLLLLVGLAIGYLMGWLLRRFIFHLMRVIRGSRCGPAEWELNRHALTVRDQRLVLLLRSIGRRSGSTAL